jgi:cytochrome P450
VLAARSVFFAEGAVSQHRRMVHRRWLETAMSADAEQRLVQVVDRSVSTWPIGRPFPLLPRMHQILAEALSPLLVDSLSPGLRHDLGTAARRLITLPAAASIAALEPHPATRPLAAALLNRHRRAFGQLADEEVRRRQASPASRTPADALGIMLGARDLHGRPFSAAAIGDDLVSLLVALVDVQAISLTWAFERLARHPAIWARLRAAADGDTAFRYAVADEILRTRPPIVGAFRTLDAPFSLAGRELPAGSRVMTAIPLIHRHQEAFPDPSAFRPERFIAGPPPAWLPFGAGARRCLGADLARATLSTVIAAVAGHTRLRPARPREETAWLLGTALVPSRRGSVVCEPY